MAVEFVVSLAIPAQSPNSLDYAQKWSLYNVEPNRLTQFKTKPAGAGLVFNGKNNCPFLISPLLIILLQASRQ